MSVPNIFDFENDDLIEEEINEKMSELLKAMVKDGDMEIVINGKKLKANEVEFAFDGKKAAITGEQGCDEFSIVVG